MASWMRGSAKIRANTNATSPARMPARAPRAMIRFSMWIVPFASVAGEAEEMAAVVDELVHVGVGAEDRHRALVDADEVVEQQGQRGGADQPHQRPGQRNDDGRGDGRGSRRGHAHEEPPSGI